MSAIGITSSSSLPPDLAAGAPSWLAVRAAMTLPNILRMHGLRVAVFAASYASTRDEAMRARAITSFAECVALIDRFDAMLFEPERHLPHQPDAAALLRRAVDAVPGAREPMDRFRATLDPVAAAMPEGPLPFETVDAIVLAGATQFTPILARLEGAMRAAHDAERDGAQDLAHVAEREAASACADIRRIARTVGIISINAGVEAARAGEHGRAFAVIAGEIKALSEQTKEASGRIGGAVDRIMARVRLG